MKRTLWYMFLAIEINLVIWLAVLGMLFAAEPVETPIKTTVVAGVVFAAIVQHWAYYSVYKRARQM